MPQRVVADRTSAARSAGQSRNGPPDAVSTSASTSPAPRPCRHWWMALCSLSTGSSGDAAARAAADHQLARHHQHFLVGERDGLSGLDGGQHGLERRRARRRAQHDVDVGMRGHVDRARRRRPGRRVRLAPPQPSWTRRVRVADGRDRRPVALRSAPPSSAALRRPRGPRLAADRDARRRRRARWCRWSRSTRESRCASRTHRRPTRTRRSRPVTSSSASMRSSTPPWPGIRLRAVLHLRRALEHRLEQVADDAERDERRAPAERAHRAASPGSHSAAQPVPWPVLPPTNPPTAPSTVFFGLIAGASSVPAEQPPRVVLRGVADDDGQRPAGTPLRVRAASRTLTSAPSGRPR